MIRVINLFYNISMYIHLFKYSQVPYNETFFARGWSVTLEPPYSLLYIFSLLVINKKWVHTFNGNIIVFTLIYCVFY